MSANIKAREFLKATLREMNRQNMAMQELSGKAEWKWLNLEFWPPSVL